LLSAEVSHTVKAARTASGMELEGAEDSTLLENEISIADISSETLIVLVNDN